MINWIGLHLRALGAALQGFARQPVATLLSVLVIGGALSLPASGYVLLGNLGELAHGLSASPTITIFLKTDAPPATVEATAKRLKEMSGLEAVRYITKDEALQQLARSGLEDVMAGLKENPLPDAYVVTPTDQSPASYEKLQKAFSDWDGVAKVQADTVWIRRLQSLLDFADRVVLLISGLLGGSLVVVTFNTIRLQIHTQRHEIQVSRLLGATRPYIQRPFFWSGLLQGLLGGGVALGITWGAIDLLAPAAASVAQNYGTSFALHGPGPNDIALILAAAVLLSYLGTRLAVGRHLKTH